MLCYLGTWRKGKQYPKYFEVLPYWIGNVKWSILNCLWWINVSELMDHGGTVHSRMKQNFKWNLNLSETQGTGGGSLSRDFVHKWQDAW